VGIRDQRIYFDNRNAINVSASAGPDFTSISSARPTILSTLNHHTGVSSMILAKQ
jgi:hypothetical protein